MCPALSGETGPFHPNLYKDFSSKHQELSPGRCCKLRQSKGLLDEAGPTQERCEWKEGILWGIQDGGGNTSTHDVSFSRKILLVEDYGRPGWDVRLGPDQKKP